jgi:SAM domain (Sterile alpha motif)
MQEITDWLTRLGLSEYAGAFAENGIDVSVLPHLTDQDLKDIGVYSGTAGKSWRLSLNSPETHRQHPSLSLRWWR